MIAMTMGGAALAPHTLLASANWSSRIIQSTAAALNGVSQIAQVPFDVASRERLRTLTSLGFQSVQHLSQQGFAPLPTLDAARHGVRFADSNTPVDQFWQHLFSEEHVGWNALGLATTLQAAGVSLSHYGQEVGLRAFIKNYQRTLQEIDRLPVHSRESLDTLREDFATWALRYAKANRLNVNFNGMDQIGEDDPVVYAIAPHSSIFPDFLLSIADPKIGFVADDYNFRGNDTAKRLGFALLFDALGQPLADRDDDARSKLFVKEMIENAVKYQTRAAWFIHGTRVPEAMDILGRQQRAGFFSAIPDPKDPSKYIRVGGAVANAIGLAQRLDKPVKLVLVTMEGAEFVMPKRTKSFPFIQSNRSGQTVSYDVAQVYTVEPTAGRREVATLGRKLIADARVATAIDPYLQGLVGEWGQVFGNSHAAEQLAERGATRSGTMFYLTADRLRSVRLTNDNDGVLDSFREQATEELVAQLGDPNIDVEAQKELLVRVTKRVVANQYQVAS